MGKCNHGASLVAKVWRERTLSEEDVALVRRTLTDVVMLIPYAVVMIVPLTPPGQPHPGAARLFRQSHV